jgi:hypothetical protein
MTIPQTSSSVTTPSSRLEKFLAKVNPTHGRLIFALDATASRQPTWDLATKIQAQMFDAVATIGGLDVQLVCFRGDEFIKYPWLSDPREIARIMKEVSCRSGMTQIQRVLEHARKEHQREKVSALVLVSDACEEPQYNLNNAARALIGVPAFLFQEGDDDLVRAIYVEIAGITGGAVASFDAGAADRLADLLKAVAAFAAGGVKALSAQDTEGARLLLTQVVKK